MYRNTTRGEVSPILVLIGILLLIVASTVISSCAVIPPGHRGVKVTLGKVSEKLNPEGFVLKAPFITSIEKVNIQQSTIASQTSCFSADLQTISISYSVLYRVPEDQVINLFRNYKGEIWDSLVKPRVEESLKQITAGYRAEEMVKSREAIRTQLLKSVQAAVEGLAIINDIPLTNIDLSDELERAIESKQVMEQSALTKTYELQKEEKEAEITLVKAKAEAESVKIKGQALAEAPRVIELELVKKWDGRAPSSVVTSAGGANIILPLAK